MRSFIRFNGVETSVEGVIPAADRFNEAVYNELKKVFPGEVLLSLEPVENFTQPDKTETIFNGIISGQYEGEAPVSVKVSKDDEVIATVPLFIGYRK